jgi:hypothetical protein
MPSLNCLVLGDTTDNSFTVQIPETKNVSILEDLIKEKNLFFWDNADTKTIELWHVNFCLDNLELEAQVLNTQWKKNQWGRSY